MQRRTNVEIHSPDADEEADGHQVALQGLNEITVTVTSADGSRTRTYSVRVREPEGEAAARPWPHCLRGDIAVGFRLVLCEGGSIEELEACAESWNVGALCTMHRGASVPYILGETAVHAVADLNFVQ